ncbi:MULTISPECIES: hypothetical protein [unclassified Chryseobacterium]|jgi:hypothetical protein|uniref:hypothetical protein n=1 Tax=unclassified Chryseobacterium TaxID=2593645 RepID=UPI00135CDC92|nr:MULTISPECIES: hypothetical protein [unclassified Chryseobacterium]MDY0931855.1 hypothetical protein [Chryseobacterium sp. CFBP8996]
MKKIIPFLMLAFVSVFTVSCDNDDDVQYVDNDTYAGVIEITRNFQYNSTEDVYFINQSISMEPSDMALVYRLKDGSNNGDVWEQIPRTLYFSGGRELDYDFDFTQKDVQILAGGNYDISTTSDYLNNQTFRIVLVPAGFLNKGAKPPVDYSDYNAVIKYYNINDSKVTKY